MKRFMYFSVSVLGLSIAVLIGFYVGSQRVEAQVSGLDIVGYQASFFNADTHNHVLLSNGDLYFRIYDKSANQLNELKYCGNILNGTAVPTTPSTWGAIKKGE